MCNTGGVCPGIFILVGVYVLVLSRGSSGTCSLVAGAAAVRASARMVAAAAPAAAQVYFFIERVTGIGFPQVYTGNLYVSV